MASKGIPATFVFPPGVVPNYDNPEHRGQGITIAAIVGTAITAIFIICRLYTRIWISRSFGKDDGECFPPMLAMSRADQLRLSLYYIRLGEPLSPIDSPLAIGHGY